MKPASSAATRRHRQGRARVPALVGTIVVAFTLAASPAGAQSPAPAASGEQAGGCPVTGGTLRVATLADTSGWVYGPENPAIWPRPLVFLTLVQTKADGSGLDGQAATSWEASPDFKTHTFHLREGLVFSDGSPLTSADVVDSWQRTLADPAIGANLPGGLAVSAPDDMTVVFTMDDPSPTFPELHANRSPIFPEGSERDAMNEQPLSAGPFILDSWQKGQGYTLKRNPNYWNQPYPCLDEVVFTVVGDANTQALQLQAGQIDVAMEIPPNQIETLRNTPGVTVPTFPTWASALIRLQRDKQPAFQDKNVRQAINYAIDKQGIIDTVLFGTGQIADSELPRTMNYVPQPPYTYDVAKAKELMAASGYPDGFSTTILTAAGDAVENGVATIVKAQLAEIGIDVTIEEIEASTKFQRRSDQDYEMFMATTSNDDLDDSGFLGITMTDCCGINTFWTGYKNPEVESLYAELKVETDPQRRHDLTEQIQQIVWDDAAQVYIAFLDAPIGMRDTVQGYEMPPTRHFYFDKIYKTAE